MEHDFTKTDILIAKVLAGEATSSEVHELVAWRALSAENELYYTKSEQIWSKIEAADLQGLPNVDTEAALAKVKQQINQATQTGLGISYRRFIYGMVGAILCLLAAFWLFKPKEQAPKQIFASNTIKTDTLMDGTMVTLNAGSGLFIDSKFGKTERRVRLQGEAFFQVAPDNQKPYIVQTPDLEVRVVGTAFNIRYHAERRETSVEVFEGKVMVTNAGLSRYLEKGQTLRFNAKEQTYIDGTTSENTIAYKTGRFTFDNTPLVTALSDIGNGYHVEFILQNADLRNCPLTARLERQSLEGLIDVLTETYGFTAQRAGNQIILTGGACE
jgi:transmembrane sensor